MHAVVFDPLLPLAAARRRAAVAVLVWSPGALARARAASAGASLSSPLLLAALANPVAAPRAARAARRHRAVVVDDSFASSDRRPRRQAAQALDGAAAAARRQRTASSCARSTVAHRRQRRGRHAAVRGPAPGAWPRCRRRDRPAPSCCSPTAQVHDVPDRTPAPVPRPAACAAHRHASERDRRDRDRAGAALRLVGEAQTARRSASRTTAPAPAGDAPVTLRRTATVVGRRLDVPVGTERSPAVHPRARPAPTCSSSRPRPRRTSSPPTTTAPLVTINGVRDRLRVLLVSGEPYPGERAWRNLLKSDPVGRPRPLHHPAPAGEAGRHAGPRAVADRLPDRASCSRRS